MGLLVDLIQVRRLSLGGGRFEVVFAWWLDDFLFLGKTEYVFWDDEISAIEFWNGESRDTRFVVGKKPIPKNRAGLHMLVDCVHALVLH